MHTDPYLFPVTVVLLFLVFSSLILHYFKQSSVIAYLVSGVLIGPSGFSLVNDKVFLSHLGSFGVVLLLFFVGLEIEFKELLRNWKISVGGTVLQIIVTLLAILGLGNLFGWTVEKSIFFAFALSLSSTAVVIQYLKEKGEFQSKVGKDVLGILIAQDLALVPMLMVLGLFDKSANLESEIFLQVVGGLGLAGLLFAVSKLSTKKIKFLDVISQDKEYQILSALSFALGLSLISSSFHLSSALGAFIAGAIIRTFRQNHWVHESLEPFRIVFLAIFFCSVGMLVDFSFFKNEWIVVATLALLSLGINTFVNMVILKLLGRSWQESFYAGALLSQLGEFTFVMAAIAFNLKIIGDYSYNIVILIVFLTMLFTPLWIFLSRSTYKKFVELSNL